MFNWDWKKYPFKTGDNPRDPLKNSGLLEGDLKTVNYFEIDSNAKKSKTEDSDLVKKIKENIDSDSLLRKGTWAYYKNSDTKDSYYLFWTSIDTNSVGVGKEIPVIISTPDNKYYISKINTVERQVNPNRGTPKYIAIADRETGFNGYKHYITDAPKYDSLEAAYDTYEKVIAKDYPDYKDTLPK